MVDRQSNSSKQAIVLVPNMFIKEEIKTFFKQNESRYGKYAITVVADDELDSASVRKMFDDLSDRIRSQLDDPPIVIPTHDRGSILHSALATVFPYIRAPSLDSEFICLHKGETFKISPPNCTLPFVQVKPEQVVTTDDLRNAGIQEFPLFIKSTVGTNTNMARKVNKLSELNDFMADHRLKISGDISEVSKFVSRFLKDSVLIEGAKNAWVIQPFVDNTAKLVCYDGLVCGGEIVPWNIHQFVFWDNQPSVIKAIYSPVELTPLARDNLREAHAFLVRELVRKGFDNQFAALEAFVTDSGKISIVEVNGRTIRALAKCYVDLCGPKGDNIYAMFQIAMGETPAPPVEDPSVHTCLGYVCISENGTAEQFINFEKAARIDEIDLKVRPDTVISLNSEWGHQVAYCYTSGNSRLAATEKCRELVGKIIIEKNSCLWLN